MLHSSIFRGSQPWNSWKILETSRFGILLDFGHRISWIFRPYKKRTYKSGYNNLDHRVSNACWMSWERGVAAGEIILR